MGRGLRRGRPDLGEHLGAGDEWMNSGRSAQARIVGVYGALIDFLTRECRKLYAAIHLFSNIKCCGVRLRPLM